MKLPVKRIRVYPNPWGIHPRTVIEGGKGNAACMDHEGRPCGVVHQDPDAGGSEPGRLVGAQVCPEATTVATQHKEEIRSPRQRTVYKFLGCSANELRPFQLAEELCKKDPVELPNTPYYRDLVAKDGCLISADLATARACGLQDKFYADVKTLFPLMAELAATAFDEQYEDGPSAYEHFISERAEAAKVTKEDDK